MDDFERRLASRLSAYEGSVPLTDAPAAAPRRVPTTWAWAGAAGVVVLAIAVGLVGSRLLTGVRPAGDGVVTSLSWTTKPFVQGAMVESLTAVDGRLIATGLQQIGTHGDSPAPAAWISDDAGTTWTAASVESPRRELGSFTHSMGQVAGTSDLLLALDSYTYVTATVGTGSETQATDVWASADRGATWHQVASVPGAAEHMVLGPDGFVVLGRRAGAEILEWQSTDGRAWEAVNPTGFDTRAWVSDVESDGKRLFAVGFRSGPDRNGPHKTPAAWSSTDGVSWSSVDFAAPESGQATSVIPVKDGFLVGGSISPDPRSEIPVLWRPAATGWVATRLEPRPSQAFAAAGPLAWNENGLLAGVSVATRLVGPANDELWFAPPDSDMAPTEQGLGGLQVTGIATVSDAFVVISNCGTSYDNCSPTVSVGVPVTSASSSSPTLQSPTPSSTDAATSTPSPQTLTPSPAASQNASLDDLLRRGVSIIDRDPGSSISSVVATDSGFVAVGSRGEDAAVWTSTDFDEWTPVDGLPASVLDWPNTVHLLDVAGARGTVVAVGAQYNVDYARPLVLVSNNGQTWSVATLPDPEQCASIETVSATPTGFIAAGAMCPTADAAQSAAIWVSADGLDWHRASVADANGGAIADLIATLRWPDRLIAVGTVTESGTGRGRVWYSSDGEKWEASWTNQDPSSMQSIAVLGHELYVGGYTGSLQSHKPTIWQLGRDGFAGLDIGLPAFRCCGSIQSIAGYNRSIIAVVTPLDAREGISQLVTRSASDGWNTPDLLLDRFRMQRVVATPAGVIVLGTFETWDGPPLVYGIPEAQTSQ